MIHTLLRGFTLIAALLFAFSTTLTAKSSYSYLPKHIYPNQLFAVTVMVKDVLEPEFLQLHFDETSPVHPLFEKPLIIEHGDDAFYTFYFKASNKDIILPELSILSEAYHKILPAQNLPLKQLTVPENFSGVVATDFKVLSTQVSNFDENNLLVTIHIEAKEANLEDMKIAHSTDNGIDAVKREFARVTGDFYAVFPLEQKAFSFSYYNTTKEGFETLTVPTLFQELSLVNSAELNPKEDNFEQLKTKGLLALILFFLVIGLFKKDVLYLSLSFIAFIALQLLQAPYPKVCVKSGTPLYILPTKTSTISTYFDDDYQTDLLDERDPYLKIEYKNGIVGWVKEEHVCED